MQRTYYPVWPKSEGSYLVRYYRALSKGRLTPALQQAMLFDVICMSDYRTLPSLA